MASHSSSSSSSKSSSSASLSSSPPSSPFVALMDHRHFHHPHPRHFSGHRHELAHPPPPHHHHHHHQMMMKHHGHHEKKFMKKLMKHHHPCDHQEMHFLHRCVPLAPHKSNHHLHKKPHKLHKKKHHLHKKLHKKLLKFHRSFPHPPCSCVPAASPPPPPPPPAPDALGFEELSLLHLRSHGRRHHSHPPCHRPRRLRSSIVIGSAAPDAPQADRPDVPASPPLVEMTPAKPDEAGPSNA